METFLLDIQTAIKVLEQAAEDTSLLTIHNKTELIAALPGILTTCCPRHSNSSSKTARVASISSSTLDRLSDASIYERSSFVAVDAVDAGEGEDTVKDAKQRTRCRARVWQSGRGGRCTHDVCGDGSNFCKQHAKPLKTAYRCAKCSKWKGEEVMHFTTWEHMGRIDQPRNPLHGFLYPTEEETHQMETFKSVKTTRKTSATKATKKKAPGSKPKVSKPKVSMNQALVSDEDESLTSPAEHQEANDSSNASASDSASDSDSDEDEDSGLELVEGLIKGNMLLVHREEEKFITASTMKEFTFDMLPEPLTEPQEIKYKIDRNGNMVHRATVDTDGSVTWFPVE